jgi:proteic killer suppression protein
MIASWADSETERIWNGKFSEVLLPDIQRVAKRKLVHVNSALFLEDLKVPPGNRLEKLSGDRRGSWSIRINDQWRICFDWENGNALNVGIVDYH